MHDLIRGMATLGHHHVDDSLRNTFAEASIVPRVIAELFATRFDKQLAAGVAPEPGSVLAAHVSRLASAGERRKLAEALHHSVCETHSRRTRMSPTIPVDRSAVAAAVGLIDQVVLRLTWSAPGERARCRAAAPAAVRRCRADVLVRRWRPGRRTARCARPAVMAPIAPVPV